MIQFTDFNDFWICCRECNTFSRTYNRRSILVSENCICTHYESIRMACIKKKVIQNVDFYNKNPKIIEIGGPMF